MRAAYPGRSLASPSMTETGNGCSRSASCSLRIRHQRSEDSWLPASGIWRASMDRSTETWSIQFSNVLRQIRNRAFRVEQAMRAMISKLTSDAGEASKDVACP